MRQAWFAAAAWLIAFAAHGQVLTGSDRIKLYPAAPAAGEYFVVAVTGSRGGSPSYAFTSTTEVERNFVHLNAVVGGGDFAVGAVYRATGAARAVDPGVYTIVLNATEQGRTLVLSQDQGTINVAATIQARDPQYRNLAGPWYAPDEAGWGVNVTQGESGALFAVWLTYDTFSDFANLGGGRPGEHNLWLVMSEGKWIAPNVFRGVLYYSHGTSLANPMIASQHYLTAFGAVTMTFVSDTEMDFKVEGTLQTTDIARTKRLQRLRF